MTSEAKIGLLLGLVVIVIIALVVNGLPSFHKNDSTNEMTESIVRLDNNPAALGAREREVSRDIQSISYQTPAGQSGPGDPPSQQSNNDVRSILAAPQSIPSNQQQGNFSSQGMPAEQIRRWEAISR